MQLKEMNFPLLALLNMTINHKVFWFSKEQLNRPPIIKSNKKYIFLIQFWALNITGVKAAGILGLYWLYYLY
jgi:hypothetical protein